MVRIEIDDDLAKELISQGIISADQIKEVTINDCFFDDDLRHKELLKASHKAYKDLKIYEFKQRHNIK